MYKVTNIRHNKDLGMMTEEQIIAKWPFADLSGAPFRAGKFIITCEADKPAEAPKKRSKKTKKAAPAPAPEVNPDANLDFSETAE